MIAKYTGCALKWRRSPLPFFMNRVHGAVDSKSPGPPACGGRGCGMTGPERLGQALSAADYDLERIFGQEDVAILRLIGLIAAMSPETTACCLEVVRAAKAHGTVVSFDLNFRAAFWKGREEEIRKAFREFASQADVLIGNGEDFQLCLGFAGPETGDRDLQSKIGFFPAMIGQVVKEYSQVRLCATTLRQAISANEHLWGAILWQESAGTSRSPVPFSYWTASAGAAASAALVLHLFSGVVSRLKHE